MDTLFQLMIWNICITTAEIWQPLALNLNQGLYFFLSIQIIELFWY